MVTIQYGPTGFALIFSHGDACGMLYNASSGQAVSYWLQKYINKCPLTIPFVLKRAAAGIFQHKSVIKGKNENSGKKGVILGFKYDGTYIGCTARGTGSSPCSPPIP